MRNKATVTALLIVFTLICVSNLFFTYQAFNYEGGLNESELAILQQDEGYKRSKRNAFSLGLDLQGGLFTTIEVKVDDILRLYAGTSIDETFTESLDSALVRKTTSDATLPELFLQELREVYLKKNNTDAAKNMIADGHLLRTYFTSPERNIPFTATDDEILNRLNKDATDAIDNTYKIIRKRVDQFGVASPNLQLERGTGRIVLEMPGVQDTARVRKLLSNTARLEFRETHKAGEIQNVMERIDREVKSLMIARGELVGDNSPDLGEDSTTIGTVDSTSQDSINNENAIVGGEMSPEVDSEIDSIQLTADAFAAQMDGSATIDDSGTTDSTGNILSDTAGLSQEEKILRFREERPFSGMFDVEASVYADRPVIGYSSVVDTAKINKWLAEPSVKNKIPRNVKFAWEAKPDETIKENTGKDLLGLIALKSNSSDKAPLEGDVITEAYQDYENNSINPAVFMNMNNKGAREWSDLTKKNKGRSIAIVMDGLVYSYPNVNGMITGGRSQISGNFTVDEAKDLANLLKAGALPISTETKGFTQVGPTLGEENLDSGLISFLIAFLATIVFMFLYYSSSGLIANVALIVNLFYILGVSAAFNIVFTLPGLAAVVLTMGMAVDANVLIFERIREEQLAGKSFKAAISSGFSNAFSSVMDANITTFLTGLILFTFGLGPIRGFAVSLMIGIVTSLICALFITRLILDRYANKGTGSIRFGTKKTLSAFSKISLNMTGRKKYMYILSGILVVGSIASIAGFQFRTGVDFKGGHQFQIEFSKDINPENLRKPMTEAFDGQVPVIRSLGSDQKLLITTSYKYEDSKAADEVLNKVIATCDAIVPDNGAIVKSRMFVGPTVAEDIKNSAYGAVGFSLLVIFLYILIRFRGIRYSMGALAALFHDVIIVLGIFSFVGKMDFLPFPLEVDQAFIAAILTIIGYSINDTVVVFDRIRENFGGMKSSDAASVYDTSINQTFSRTLITSLTTLLTILILLVFAGDVIRPFMFALFIGIIVGTYSSIFVASPISLDLMNFVDRPSGKKSAGQKKK